jgi:lipopolysaccharide biosynthesis glycosyltransferase/glycosyltransferase involved in cell wall biosynthesis
MNIDAFEIIPRLERPGLPIRTIVLATDENFVPPAGIMLSSLLEVVSRDVFYDIVVLDNEITPASRDLLEGLVAAVDHAAIRFFGVTHLLSDVLAEGDYSKAAYLTVFIPYLFRTHEKVLYLDCDMIVRADVSELFDTQFDNEYVACTRDVGIAALARGGGPLMYKGRLTSWKRYAARLGFTDKDYEDAVNTGMIVYNIPAFVNDGFSALRDAEKHLRIGYLLVDQCVLNILLRGRVKYVHMRWNYQVQNWGAPRLLAWFANEYREAERDPAIIHYITPFKPWRNIKTLHADAFWRVARKTRWFQSMQLSRFTESFLPWVNHSVPVYAVSAPAAPFFSIIMPVYNRAGLLERSLQSILLQTFADFEIIIVDDASTDSTVDAINSFAQRDPRIRLICLEKNGGPGPARNVAIEQARGRYIRICDSDDFYPPEALSLQARQIEEQPVDLAAGNLIRWHSVLGEARPHAGPWLITRDVHSRDVLELPELWSMQLFHRCAFRRDFLMENHIRFDDLRRGEDPAFMASVLSCAQSFSLIQDPVYLFHARPREHCFSYQEIRDDYIGHNLIIQRMKDAGLEEAAYCHFPYSSSYANVSEKEALQLAEMFIGIVAQIPMDILKHPYFTHPDLDVMGLRHDLLLVQNVSPQELVELIRRGLLSAPARERERELQHLKRDRSTIDRNLHRVGLSLEKMSRLKCNVVQFRARIRRTWMQVKTRRYRKKSAQWGAWLKAGGDLPNL